MPVYDELYKFKDELQHVLVRHEQGATHAAQGYARATESRSSDSNFRSWSHKPSAGIADAQIDSTPMVCITGQVGKHLLGSDAFQETDIIGISTPVTKWNYQITEASEIPEIMAKAFTLHDQDVQGPF
jgi:acetolactate synthase-1/2/3 large subunit